MSSGRCSQPGRTETLRRHAKLIHRDIEVDVSQVSTVPAVEARGSDGLEGVIADWLEVWGSQEYSPYNFIDAGDDVIVWLGATARGRGSGVTVDFKLAVVYALADGRVIGFRGYDTLTAAATAVPHLRAIEDGILPGRWSCEARWPST